MEGEEEEEETTSHRGRPNLWWAHERERLEAERRWLEQQASEPDNFGSDFRAVKNKRGRGGAATVKDEDTIGDYEHCWCGLPLDHDWPGKASGRKHPKEHEMPTDTLVNRKDLRAFHDDLQEVIVQAVNTYGCRHRIANNSVLLYPPDGSRPFTIYARNSDRQVRAARTWFIAHVLMLDERGKPQNPLIKDGTIVLDDFERRAADAANREVDEDAIRSLAERVNSPEHTPPPKKQASVPPPPAPTAKRPDPEWSPHVHKGRASPNFESRRVNGTWEYRCIKCHIDSNREDWITTEARKLGGHYRVNHTDVSTMYSPEARAKASKKTMATKARKRNAALVEELVSIAEQVAKEFDVDLPSRGDDEEVAALRKEVETLRDRLLKAETKAGLFEEKANDAEAKLALIREASGL